MLIRYFAISLQVQAKIFFVTFGQGACFVCAGKRFYDGKGYTITQKRRKVC